MKHFILSVDEINKLQIENEAYKQSEQEASEIIAELKAELQKFKDMAKKGLDEFKDVGGCWGCGLQLQLNQDLEDIKQLKAENDELKENFEGQKNAYKKLNSMYMENCEYTGKLEQTLQEIKGIVTALYMNNWLQMNETARKSIQLLQDLITKAEEE